MPSHVLHHLTLDNCYYHPPMMTDDSHVWTGLPYITAVVIYGRLIEVCYLVVTTGAEK